MNLKVKQLHPKAVIPSYQTAGASGIDLHVCGDEAPFLYAGERALISTGIAVEIPEGYEGQVRPRSGRSLKGFDVILGTIDTDYRGEIGIIFVNNSGRDQELQIGDRIAQLVIVPVARCQIEMVLELSTNTERGANGFGSTGT